jgi:hypothetical protein
VGSLRRSATVVAVLAGTALLPASADAYPAPNDSNLPAPSVIVSMEVTGGIAGIDEYLAIGSNGAARLDTRDGSHRFKLGKRRLKDLRARLTKARWQRLKSEYPAPAGTADGFSYSIIYRGHDVRTGDGARLPLRLERVVSALQRIRSEHG